MSGGGGYASETQVRRGDRVVHGNKELIEKLGRNDLCPCGSGRRFQKMLPALRALRRERAELLRPRLEFQQQRRDGPWPLCEFGEWRNWRRGGFWLRRLPARSLRPQPSWLRRVGRAARHRGANATRPKGWAGSTPALSAILLRAVRFAGFRFRESRSRMPSEALAKEGSLYPWPSLHA